MTIHIQPPVGAGSFAERVQRVRSPGGIEAWLIEDHTLPILSMSFGFRGGSTADPAGKAGTARMLADLLTEGAGSLDGDAFRRALGRKAIRLSFGAQLDSLNGRLQTMVRHTDEAFALLGLALRAPLFAPDAVDRVRDALSGRVRGNLCDPGQVAMRTFFAHGFPDHAYGRAVDGELATVATIDRDDVVGLWRHVLTRGHLRIAVVGALGAEALGHALDLAFADLPAGAIAPTPHAPFAGTGERIVTRLAAPQSTLYFGRPGIMRDDPDFLAATVANHCLGGGQGPSRLYHELREKRGLCYSVWTGLYATEGACAFLGSTSTPNPRVGEALALIAAEISRLGQDGLDPEELEAAKSNLIGSHLLKFDSSASIARLLLSLQLEGRDPTWLDARNRHIAAVTREDTNRAIHRLVGDGSLLVAIAGDPPDT